MGARGDGLTCWFLPMLQDQKPAFIHGFYADADREKEEVCCARLGPRTTPIRLVTARVKRGRSHR